MSCTDHGVWVLFSSKWCNKFCAHLISVMVVAFARASSIKVEIIGIWRVHIICIIFKLKLAFSAPLLTTYTQRPSRTIKKPPKSDQNIPIHCTTWTLAIFHALELYSTNQILFCQLRLRSITCYFLVNNLHFIAYSDRIVRPHWKKIHMELKATDCVFF